MSGVWADDFWATDFWADGFWSGEASVGAAITNATASTASINNYEICSRTGFKVKRGKLIKDEQTGLWVRPDSFDRRHPSEYVRSVAENQHGSPRPEPTDVFLSTNEVKSTDL